MKLRTLWVTALAVSLAVTACGERASAQSRSTSSYRGGYGSATQVAATEDMPSRDDGEFGEAVLIDGSTHDQFGW